MAVYPDKVSCPVCFAKRDSPCTRPDDNGRVPVKWFHWRREQRASEYTEDEDLSELQPTDPQVTE